MNAQPSHRLTRRPLAAALAALIGLAAALTMAQPAAAHDALVSADPASGSVVTSLPDHVALTFSAAVLDEPGGTVVEVTDAAGTNLAVGDPVVDRSTVTQALAGTATGEITVTWHIVSADGHVVSDSLSFTVEQAPASPTPSETAAVTAAPSATAEPTPEPTVTTLITVEQDSGPGLLPWLIGAGVVVVVLAIVVVLLLVRSRQNKVTAAQRTAGRDGHVGR